jgi:hypothetical protein
MLTPIKSGQQRYIGSTKGILHPREGILVTLRATRYIIPLIEYPPSYRAWLQHKAGVRYMYLHVAMRRGRWITDGTIRLTLPTPVVGGES